MSKLTELEGRALRVLALLDDEVIDFDMIYYPPLHATAHKTVVTIYPESCRKIIHEIFSILREYKSLKDNVTEPKLKGDKDVCQHDNSIETQEPW